jgi:hypothetical protein
MSDRIEQAITSRAGAHAVHLVFATLAEEWNTAPQRNQPVGVSFFSAPTSIPTTDRTAAVNLVLCRMWRSIAYPRAPATTLKRTNHRCNQGGEIAVHRWVNELEVE